MSAIINATPALRFIEDLNGALYRCGYGSTVDSLHQANPEKDQWNLHLTVTPHTLTGKCARIALQLDNIAENGRTARVELDHLKLEPRDSRKVRDSLRREIESHSTRSEMGMYTTHLGYIVSDTLDEAGVDRGLAKSKK